MVVHSNITAIAEVYARLMGLGQLLLCNSLESLFTILFSTCVAFDSAIAVLATSKLIATAASTTSATTTATTEIKATNFSRATTTTAAAAAAQAVNYSFCCYTTPTPTATAAKHRPALREAHRCRYGEFDPQ